MMTTTTMSMRTIERMARMMRTMTSDHLFDTVFLLLPFWCLDAKGEEELSIYVSFIVFIWIWLVRHYLVCVDHVDKCFKNHVVCL
jgi:hypothetical protein